MSAHARNVVPNAARDVVGDEVVSRGSHPGATTPIGAMLAAEGTS